MHNLYRPVVPEFILIVSAERYYIGTSYMPTGPSKYHQNDHVAELVAVVSLNERAVRSFLFLYIFCLNGFYLLNLLLKNIQHYDLS